MAEYVGFRNRDEKELELDSEDDLFMRQYARELMQKNGGLEEYKTEDEVILMTTEKTLIVHIYHPSFKKCELMNSVLRKIAPEFPHIKFASINVQNCPHMASSLRLKILPFLGFFKGGYFVDHLVGFEKLGNRDALEPADLIRYIKESYICQDERID